MNAQEFVNIWRHNTQKETSFDREHFNNLCALINHPTPNAFDPTGKIFGFQSDLKKNTGAQGYADVWYKDHFAWEYKGSEVDFKAAFDQLLQYHGALGNPPLLIVANAHKIVIRTKFTNTPTQEYILTLDDLLTHQGLTILRNIFTNPEALKKVQSADEVSEKAAIRFGEIAGRLQNAGHPPLQVAHFLIRLLFCLFAEDAGLLPNQVITRLILETRTQPEEFRDLLQQIFGLMSTGGRFGFEKILHFNGHLFDSAEALLLDSHSLQTLADISNLDWFRIRPSIFGTLFERGLDPAKRTQLGAHYTGEEDILLIVEPVLMAPLRRRWTEIKAQSLALAAKRDAAKGKERENLEKKLRDLLVGFSNELSQIQILDAACGSGNFLYVALRLLLELEQEVVRLAGQLGIGSFFHNVGPEQLHGIEINEYAHQLAQATIWIGYIQWLKDNGLGAANPVLKPLDNIQHMDAILAFDEHGQPYEPAWPKADVIIGNPPFLGGSLIRSQIKPENADALASLYKGRLSNFSDLVCYWFEKARAMVEKGDAQRVGLLATQAIRGGVNREVLARIKQTGDIFLAYSDRKWILDGANVHISIIGFDNGTETQRLLDGVPVQSIHADLTSGLNLTQAKRLKENFEISFRGTQKGGKFDISAEQAEKFLSLSNNPNGKPNLDVVRPWINGEACVGRPSKNTWIIDFAEMPEAKACLYAVPFEYVRQHVYPDRSQNNRERRAKYWWLHSETAPGMRQAVANLVRYIATPRISKHRLFVWVPAETLPDDGVYIFARADDYFFGVLHSRPHELWARRMGTQLREAESGFRYTSTTTFETYPFPWPPGHEPAGDPRVEAIAQAARELVQMRDNVLKGGETLTGLYNKRPTWLANAHRKLDQVVFAAYGWPADLTDDQILERLLALNLERSG